ncbi:MAG: Holliday junction branch migration protein RuvA [bacterium]|nr:Holliday junction branch migration protein RuvA [bacterium]
MIRGDGKVLLDVGFVSMELTMPTAQARELREGEPVQLFTYLQFSSQSDTLKLFAFTSQLARDLFAMLIRASGIGPAVAVALLDLGVPALATAIRSADERTLTKVTGVGPKLAKKIILELGDKIDKEFGAIAVGTSAPSMGKLPEPLEDALQAVIALGFPRTHAEAAMTEVRTEYGGDETVVLIRRMLAQLHG